MPERFQAHAQLPLIFERSKAGRRASQPPAPEQADLSALLGAENLRQAPPRLPEVSELDLVRHYTQLAHRQMSIDANIYPLGSCTMKYNPKVNEEAAKLFQDLHPYQAEETVQGALQLLFELQGDLATITGMDAVSLQPAAGAHGELAGILMIRAYHRARGEGEQRRIVLVPDGAHGTNPATAAMAGYAVVEVPTGPDGEVDLAALKARLTPEVAAVMLTNPNTLGLFERRIVQIAEAAHAVGAQLYYDGANLNAIVGRARPGDMGFDVVHLNLHKTFTTPHGGGGPGTGPVGVKAHLREFLPVPVVAKDGERYFLDEDAPNTIGRMRSFYGNFGNLVRAYTYIRSLGREGLREVSGYAVLNANYLRMRFKELGFTVPFDRVNMHEFVAQPPAGLRTLDIAKAQLDHGMHPATVYFPLIVKEALMVEPTETESLESLDAYVDTLAEILERAAAEPEYLRGAPYSTPVRRLDEVRAARQPVLRYDFED
ncbi:MAG: aminomethyl-transferring glycine dehydrogenase subunit GcvPB [Trueperaceae bacterium]|nr:aminomethyl-transferring glycine dehydrogenase subunit GcvPB [Trueperaceae bacterium]MCO5174362.1 aminomethyl-transferring glycine dehydrogenase subunit GcvPB [Trueperaceae bacterium]MCW5820701.1 aminomethyl-transferring glycine dehydrogenase subunit GcvPB [Trueperaceae bacterium]